MIFFKKKEINSKEFEKIMTDVIVNQKKIEKLEHSVEIMKSSVLSVRGLINRKLGMKDDEDTESNPINKQFCP